MAVSAPIQNPNDSVRGRVADPASGEFTINALSVDDLKDALRKGWADFMAMPSHLIFLAAVYPIVAFLLAQLTYSFDLLPLFFPLVAGFAIMGPFVGVFLYEISRRRELGDDPRWKDALKVWDSPGRGSILAVGLALFVIFAAWMAAADRLWVLIMGAQDFDSVGGFLRGVLTTGAGWTLIVVGHIVGFVFAAAAYMISVVSFPLLLDRQVGAGEAMRASVMTVRRNPWVMTVWAAIIAAGLMAGSALLFVGLVIVLPVLAHASWHLYRRAVAWG
jgi:uncharacterized membrane protein